MKAAVAACAFGITAVGAGSTKRASVSVFAVLTDAERAAAAAVAAASMAKTAIVA